MHRLVAVTVCVLLAYCGILASGAPQPASTFEAAYPGLSMGPLRSAILSKLPKGTILRSGNIAITEFQVR